MGTKCPTPLELYDYNAGRLKGPRCDEIEEHIGGCGDCKQRLSGEGLFDEAMRQAVEDAVPADALARMTGVSEASRRHGDERSDDQTRGSP